MTPLGMFVASAMEILMDLSRCPVCKRRLIAMTDRTGRTNMACLKCDNVDPMKTDALKWAASGLARSGRSTPES
jgi:hypothetical protein